MATMTPERKLPPLQEAPDREHLVAALRPWQRRLTLQRLVSWTLRGVVSGLLLACFILLLSRFFPWATANYWAMSFALFSIVLAFGYALWSRPSLAATAYRVDVHLALYDRVGTAWELGDEVSVLSKLQRRDALDQLKKYTPKKSLSLRPQRSLLIFFTTLVLITSLLIVLPNPMNAILKQQVAFQNTMAKQIKAIDKTRQGLTHQTAIPPAQQKQIDQILRNLETKLQQAKNNAQAQQAIAEAQAKLDQMRDPQAANKAQGRSAASTSLQNNSNPTLGALGQALATGDSKQLSNALKNLASQVNKLTPAQRSKLAQQIEQAANKASSNPALSKSLHQLAKSVASGTPSEVTDAASAVSSASAQDTAGQAQDAAVGQVSQSVQQAANDLSDSTDGTSQNQGQGKGQSQGQGKGQAQGQGQGQWAGTGPREGSRTRKGTRWRRGWRYWWLRWQQWSGQ